MQSFRLQVGNNVVVTGAHSIPAGGSIQPTSAALPLIVGLHGGGYDHRYFDALPGYSAKDLSVALGVPFVSIDRPSYGGTTSVLPIPANSDFTEESAKVLNQSILPGIWNSFGLANRCSCMIILAHSFGVMPAIATAALHAGHVNPGYPLGGLILSGMGNTVRRNDARHGFEPVDDPHIKMSHELKDTVMFKPGTCSPAMLQETIRLDSPMPLAEVAEFAETWMPHWKEKYASRVQVPVFYMLVEDDPFFFVDDSELRHCVTAFVNSPRAEGSLMLDAPHCVELSHWSSGWYARCFGFALECAASFMC